MTGDRSSSMSSLEFQNGVLLRNLRSAYFPRIHQTDDSEWVDFLNLRGYTEVYRGAGVMIRGSALMTNVLLLADRTCNGSVMICFTVNWQCYADIDPQIAKDAEEAYIHSVRFRDTLSLEMLHKTIEDRVMKR